MARNQDIQSVANEDTLFQRVSELIEASRKYVNKAIDTAMVYTYFGVGQYIVEYQQHGKSRAEYGKGVLKRLSERLSDTFGKGWSVDTLEKARKFFNVYSNSATLQRVLEHGGISATPQRKSVPSSYVNASDNNCPFTLSWNHYQILMRIENAQARNFYEIEAHKQNWSVRQLQRQVGQTIEKPSDLLKNPLSLEFLGLKPDSSYSESKLESAIIDKLQMFLLELGKGFLFEGRQKRFTFEEDNFYVDLVFYNRLLQCYVLIDLKTDKLTHQDLGQMQMYVNYFDRYVRTDFEKPTIGILLCETKNDALVELTLPKDANIYAQQYALCLPDKVLLQQKLAEWVAEYKEFEENHIESL